MTFPRAATVQGTGYWEQRAPRVKSTCVDYVSQANMLASIKLFCQLKGNWEVYLKETNESSLLA